MDPSILRNLDTQSRRLGELEADLDRLPAADTTTDHRDGHTVEAAPDYDALTEANDRLRDARGWDQVELAAAMTSAQWNAFEAWRSRQRIPWRTDDVVAVGLATALGFAATWFDAEVDRDLRTRLKGLKDSDLVRSWERDARGLAIDHTGPGFGGPDHRVRSSGHDLARPLAALRQIREGTFRGDRWENKVRIPVTRDGFVQADSIAEALALWAKHLAADVVTTMSLPLPGWTYLYRMPSHQVRKFAHDVYRGKTLGEGLNLRSGAVTPTLAVLASETVIRAHVCARVLAEPDRSTGTASEQALQRELLLAAHSAVAAASVGKTLGRALVTGSGPLALRHINVAVLLRVGMLALQVRGDIRDRADTSAGEWGDLLADSCPELTSTDAPSPTA